MQLLYNPKIVLFNLLLLFCFFSCQNNRLKTNENSLIQTIKIEEEFKFHEKRKMDILHQNLADSIAKLPKGMRFLEDRSTDKYFKPIVIDIEKSRLHPVNDSLKWSSLFKRVKYIRLEQDPDSLISRVSESGLFGGSILFGNNHIYFSNHVGTIIQFTLNGEFCQYVCKSQLYYDRSIPIYKQFVLFQGARNPYFVNGKLYYKYEDQIEKKYYCVVFDDKEERKQSLQKGSSNEVMVNTNVKGNLKLNFNNGNHLHYATHPYFINDSLIAYTTTRKVVGKENNLISLATDKWDTLCCYPNHDKVANFGSTVYRGVEEGNSYYYNNILHLRQAYNDTVYMLMPPNRLVPKYILKFGDQGLENATEAVSPHISLEDKLIMESFLETKNYLFITYTKNYVCPNNKKTGTVFYSRILFDKVKKTIISAYMDEPVNQDLSTKNIVNDFDFMPSKWPDGVTQQGNSFIQYRREQLKSMPGVELNNSNLHDSDIIIAVFNEN